MRFRAFEFENCTPDSPYFNQLARYKAATVSLKDLGDAQSKSELVEAFLDLHRAFTAWKDEP